MNKSLRNYTLFMVSILVVAIVAVLILSSVGSAYATPLEYRQAISEVVSDYCVVQKALANDDLQNFELAAEHLNESAFQLGIISMRDLPDQLKPIWKYEVLELHQAAVHLRGWADITAARVFFQRVSLHLSILVVTMGHAHNVPIYVVRCPMAFDNEGADWLQDSEQIRNPYFGKEMLECGQITKTFPPGR